MGFGVMTPATITPGARVMLDGTLCYPAPDKDDAQLRLTVE